VSGWIQTWSHASCSWQHNAGPARTRNINILGVDIGGATTDVFSVIDGVFNRSVSANLGMSYSSGNVLVEAELKNIERWLPLAPVIDATAVLDVAGLVDNAVAQICECVSDVLGDLKGLIATGRYSYLAGHGDYFEMAYSVLVGLLLNWAAQDGLISRPPAFGITGDRVFLKRSIGQRIRGFYPVLTGIGVLEQPELLWEKITSACDWR
jgi:hypothetical protein